MDSRNTPILGRSPPGLSTLACHPPEHTLLNAVVNTRIAIEDVVKRPGRNLLRRPGCEVRRELAASSTLPLYLAWKGRDWQYSEGGKSGVGAGSGTRNKEAWANPLPLPHFTVCD